MVLEAGSSFARISFTDELASRSTFLPKFPAPGGVHGHDEVTGISFPTTRPEVIPGITTWVDELDFRDIEIPAPSATWILFNQLRACWGANIDYDRLLEAVTALDSQSLNSSWGRL